MRLRVPPIASALALAVAGVWIAADDARAQGASHAEQARALEVFSKLGLPDARGAKWVQARMEDRYGGEDSFLPGGEEAHYTGNAWLVREEKNGIVELIVDHTRRVRARRAKGGEDESPDKLPMVQIKEADLEGDLKKLAAALQPKGKKERNGVRVGGNYVSGDEARPALAASVILLCAHLQHQGRAEPAAGLLRDALAYAGDAGSALDYALSTLADDRLRRLTDEFVEKRDAAAYAQAIEKLAGEFSRGWEKREAALLLARRAREHQPAPAATEPAAKKAADLLLALKREDVESLPMGSNWLLAASTEVAPDEQFRRYYRGRRGRTPPAGNSNSPPAAFFTERRTAFAAIARLLDDHRLTGVRNSDVVGSHSSYFSGQMPREERVRRAYNELDRPSELREVAWRLVEQVIPGHLRSEIDDLENGRAERVLAWFETIAALSDDDLAWSALRESGNSNDGKFGTALGFLVEKGSADSQKRLREVFLDPWVWSGGSGSNALAPLEAYAAKLGPEAGAFGEKLRPIVVAAIKSQHAEQMANYGDRLPPEQRKMYERQADGEIKKFDQIFKPQGLAEILAELVAADKAGSMEIWQTLQGQLGKTPWPQVEAQLFQSAPKAKDPAVRSGILSLIMQHGMQDEDPDATKKKKVAPPAPDAATREAVTALLDDKTPLPEPIYWAPSAQDFGDFTALAFVYPRLPEGENLAWGKVLEKFPEFGIGWIKARARTLAAGQPPPPMPDGSRAPTGRADEILKEVGGIAPEKVLAALLAKTPDEQAAVAEQLGKLTEWPPALLGARLTVTGLQVDDSAVAKSLNASRWVGRRFDEAMRGEITAAVEKVALDGHACMVGFAPVGTLGGLKFIYRGRGGSGSSIDKKQFERSKTPVIEGQGVPAAIVSDYFTAREEGQTKPVVFAYALWKDANLSRAWREKFARPAEPGAKPAPEDGEAARFQQQGFPGKTNDPTPLDNAVRDLIAGKSAARGQFGLWWMARPIKDAKEAEESPEEEEDGDAVEMDEEN